MNLSKRLLASLPVLVAASLPHAARGQVSFTKPTLSDTQKAPIWMVSADLNGDGKADLAVANAGDSTLTVSLGNGDGTFRTPVPYPTGSNCAINYMAAGD